MYQTKDIPPALSIILEEGARSSSVAELRRRIRSMWRDLRDQSEAFEFGPERETDRTSPLAWDVHLHGALDLLSGDGCRALQCRLNTAERIARSVGLIADHVWLTDTLSSHFIESGRVTNAKLDTIIADVMVLNRLLPLIKAGVVKFRSPWVSSCQSCSDEFDRRVGEAVSDIARLFRNDFKLDKTPEEYVLHVGKCLEPTLEMHWPKTDEDRPSASDIVEYWVRRELRSTFWIAREAALTGGSVLTNSRLGLTGLLRSEGRLLDRRTLLLLDKEREFNIPWVSELNAEQIVQLREEASAALPTFREKLARAMSANTVESLSSGTPNSVIAELREQSAEVRAELTAKRKNSARYWKVAYGLLGLGLSAYGVANDQVLPGVGGLLPILHLLIGHKTGYEADVSKITSRPGYVLVKAQDILAHSNG